MKLQNMAVVFLIIVIPIIILLSYYISLQVDTLNMQAAYNTKLLESAKEAISAFEINTVEWNEAYSETADSKRRDIMASINTFINSFANEMGTSGISKEYILPYIPALAYTLYDGYYIYSPSEIKETIKNSNGVTVFISEDLSREESLSGKYRYKKEDNGKILYAYSGNEPDGYYNGTPFTLDINKCTVSTYSHVLKPFSTYSAQYKKRDTDIIVNYTLDNYITIHGKINGNYLTKSGYYIDTSYVKNMPRGTWKNIIINKKNNDITIQPETLNEIIWYKDLSEPKGYDYVYASDNTKVYFEGDTTFQVNSSGERINLSDLTSVKYKKLVILNRNNNSTTEIYQALTDGTYRILLDGNYRNLEIKAGKWYYNMEGEEYPESIDIDIKSDVSSINYYVEAYSFTNWINSNLNGINVYDMVGNKEGITTTGKIFENPEEEGSVFLEHKREVIKQSVISSLNQAITSYSRNSEGTYRLPVLLETDWDQILSNVSIIVFAQNIPIGLKTYNNYAISTSTNNKEYVDTKEIFLNVKDGSDKYYHLPYCKHISQANSLIGYRNIDYTIKFYEVNEKTNYYYRHSNICREADYYCLVQRSLYEETISVEQTRAYETALARERYVAHEFN